MAHALLVLGPPQLAGQPLGLAVGGLERVTLLPNLSVGRGDGPGELVAGDAAVPPLELQHVQAVVVEQDDVVLPVAPVAVAEQHVGPHMGGGGVGQQLAQGVERGGLMRLGGFTHRMPLRVPNRHGPAALPRTRRTSPENANRLRMIAR